MTERQWGQVCVFWINNTFQFITIGMDNSSHLCALQVRNLCYMVTKREKMRNRFLESKRDIFVHQSAILRSQSGRKLNARDYQAVINAHRQSPSVYDYPEAIVRTARHCEAMASTADESEVDGSESFSVNKVTDQAKQPKMPGRPRIKGHLPGQSNKTATARVIVQKKRLQSTENPYAKPTYRSFEWLLPSRRRSSAGADDTPVVKRKRRRKLFGGNVSPSEDDVSSSVVEDDSSVGILYLEVTGSDVTPDREPSLNKLPSPNAVKDRISNAAKDGPEFAGDASPREDKRAVSVNGTFDAGDDSVSTAADHLHEPYSSTPLKRSPLHSIEAAQTSNHVSTALQSSPRFNMSKLQARHFSDILVDNTSPSGASRNRTVSQNEEDAYIDVVSDNPVVPSTSNHSVNNQRSVRNGFAEGLSRLSKMKTKKHLAAGGLVNGLRQRTLDSFVRRVPNGNQCANSVVDTVENGPGTETKNHDLKHNSSSSIRLKQQDAVDRAKESGEVSDKHISDERTAGSCDNFVDMDSIEGVWRRRTSLRSSTAFMNLLGQDLADLT